MHTEPFPDDPAAALAIIAGIAAGNGRPYLVAWIEGAFFAVDQSAPQDVLVLRFGALIPAEVRLDIPVLARWLVAADGTVSDLA